MTQYNLRSADGKLKAIIPADSATEALANSTGEWGTTTTGNQRHTLQFPDNTYISFTVYTITTPLVLIFMTGDYIEIEA